MRWLNELPRFKETSLKFLNGEMSKLDYKGFSGGYGVYAQRDQKSFMIRLRTSSGVISKSQLHTIYNMAYENKLEKIHLTTRQAIQLHDLSVDQVCNIMEEGIHKDIFSRGGGGNFPRNVGLSPLSGVDPDEAFDVAPYAVATDKHFISKITTYHLPRKLKVSYSSSNHDAVHCTVQDLWFIATLKNDKPYFDVYVGGGLGKNPIIRTGMTEEMYILNLDGNEAKRILEISKKISGDSKLEKSISCIGVPICQMGIQNSQKMLHNIIDYFRENVDKEIMNKLPRIYISGCPNSCGVHQIGHIGLSGKIKKIDGIPTDVFEISICGNFEVGKSRLGTSIGDFKASDIPEFLHELAKITEGDFFEFATNNTEKVLNLSSKYKI